MCYLVRVETTKMENQLRPRTLRSTYLNINSANDIHAEAKEHNPANFEVSMPNSLGSTNVWRVVPHTISIPNVFPNVYAPFNEMTLWQRKGEVVDLGGNTWLVRGSLEWQKTTITIPEGFYTADSLVATLASGPLGENYVVQIVEAGPGIPDRYIQIVAKSIPFTQMGLIVFPENPPTAPAFCNVGFLSEPVGSRLFDILGLGSLQLTESDKAALSPQYKDTMPNTMDSIAGSPFERLVSVVPLFDIHTHDYTAWFVYPVARIATNPINLSKPALVEVVIDQLGDNTTTDGETGLSSSVIARIPMDETERGKYATRLVHDCDAEAIQFRVPRTIRSFKVSLRDMKGVTLTLPRNWPTFMRFQFLTEE